MRKLKYAVVLNMGVLLGCLIALYLAPGTTPIWVFALACVGYAIAMNLAFFLGPRLRKIFGTPAKTRASRTVEVWIITVLCLLALILMRLRYIPSFKP